MTNAKWKYDVHYQELNGLRVQSLISAELFNSTDENAAKTNVVIKYVTTWTFPGKWAPDMLRVGQLQCKVYNTCIITSPEEHLVVTGLFRSAEGVMWKQERIFDWPVCYRGIEANP